MTNRDDARFRVIFSGPALQSGTMDVRELAPALLALGGICERANELLNGAKTSATVRVEARFESGSFDVGFIFSQAAQAAQLFTPDNVHNANEILKLLGIGSGIGGGAIGLFKLIRKLKGRVAKDLPKDSDGNVTININNTTVIFPYKVVQLATDPQIRTEAEKVVSPVRREGIDEMRFEESGEIVETIKKEDVCYFSVPSDLVLELQKSHLPQENVYTLEIVTPQFDTKLKWRLQSEGLRLTATMKDEAFLERIHKREIQFGEGDVLTVRVRSVQAISAMGKPTTDSEIVEVLEYRPAPVQLRLPEN